MHVCAGGCKAEGQPLLSQFQGPLKLSSLMPQAKEDFCGAKAGRASLISLHPSVGRSRKISPSWTM